MFHQLSSRHILIPKWKHKCKELDVIPFQCLSIKFKLYFNEIWMKFQVRHFRRKLDKSSHPPSWGTVTSVHPFPNDRTQSWRFAVTFFCPDEVFDCKWFSAAIKSSSQRTGGGGKKTEFQTSSSGCGPPSFDPSVSDAVALTALIQFFEEEIMLIRWRLLSIRTHRRELGDIQNWCFYFYGLIWN